ncbi:MULTISPECIES: hypothetical protein [unclassified Carboxylicivirga]|uniref:hypothetical protein n=1 Tax=Carboxylicivirga TaxID=1628153 RepID=UPI003D328DCF
MKFLYSVFICCLLSLLPAGAQVIESRVKSTERFMREFEAANIEHLKIANQHGNIFISAWDEDLVEVETLITLGTRNETAREEILEMISINQRNYSGILDYMTTFSEDFFSNYPFSIDYHVKMPARLNLIIDNSMGDVSIDSIMGVIKLTQSYGKLQLQDIAPNKKHHFDLTFVDGRMDNIGDGEFTFSNCNLQLTQGGSMKGQTQYGMLNFENFGALNITSNTDRIAIANIDSIQLSGNRCIAKLEQVSTSLFCELIKGQLNIDAAPSIKEITISNQAVNTTIKLPLGLAYIINGEVSNGRFTHPTPQHLQLFKENNRISFSGNIGGEASRPANVILFNKDAFITIKN